jgi:hypothetical protein
VLRQERIAWLNMYIDDSDTTNCPCFSDIGICLQYGVTSSASGVYTYTAGTNGQPDTMTVTTAFPPDTYYQYSSISNYDIVDCTVTISGSDFYYVPVNASTTTCAWSLALSNVTNIQFCNYTNLSSYYNDMCLYIDYPNTRKWPTFTQTNGVSIFFDTTYENFVSINSSSVDNTTLSLDVQLNLSSTTTTVQPIIFVIGKIQSDKSITFSINNDVSSSGSVLIQVSDTATTPNTSIAIECPANTTTTTTFTYTTTTTPPSWNTS